MRTKHSQKMLFGPRRPRRPSSGLMATGVFWVLWLGLILISPMAEGAVTSGVRVTWNENLLVGIVVYVGGAALWLLSRTAPNQAANVPVRSRRAHRR